MIDRDEAVEKLVDAALEAAEEPDDLKWYVVEYYSRLSDGDLEQEVNDITDPTRC